KLHAEVGDRDLGGGEGLQVRKLPLQRRVRTEALAHAGDRALYLSACRAIGLEKARIAGDQEAALADLQILVERQHALDFEARLVRPVDILAQPLASGELLREEPGEEEEDHRNRGERGDADDAVA